MLTAPTRRHRASPTSASLSWIRARFGPSLGGSPPHPKGRRRWPAPPASLLGLLDRLLHLLGAPLAGDHDLEPVEVGHAAADSLCGQLLGPRRLGPLFHDVLPLERDPQRLLARTAGEA